MYNLDMGLFISIPDLCELPVEHFTDTEIHPPLESINVGFGLGIKYPISHGIYLDLRYIRQFHVRNRDGSLEFLPSCLFQWE